MTFESKAKRVLQYASQLAHEVNSWADFATKMFDQSTGYIAKTFPEELERQLFLDSPEYTEVNATFANLMNRVGVIAGSVPTKSGKFVVRLPKTMHHVLEIEAKREGVSLNQLVVSKLALPLQTATGLAADLIITAFNKVHAGHAPDWIIVHPEFNERYIERCYSLGLKQSVASLNHSLLNIRKNPKYKGKLNPTTVRSGFHDYDDYSYAAEIAVRAVQRTEGVPLDRILCDPQIREQFDRLALELASDQTELKLRCAALNLRKTHRLRPLKESAVVSYSLSAASELRRINLDALWSNPGGYALFDQNWPIFAGATDNLKNRLTRHLRYGFPSCIGLSDDLRVGVLDFANVKRDNRLIWLDSFVSAQRPLLNYQKSA